ncbi:MAG: Leucyl/phenylalanyl-tRNA--protein transferase [Humibacillus sp.]|nr:Leucyl/phenylalanyl-tRNA--protein transferase [Humibacillus sp.]
MPTPPPPTSWHFALDAVPEGEDLVGVGADLEVGTLVAAYSLGIFPMGLGDHGGPPMGWWSPDPRGVLRLPDLRVTRSLRKSMAHFDVRVDTAFEEVLDACADPTRDGRWITEPVRSAYVGLHRAGWAHSVETWRDGELVGGLYGVAIGGLFAGESMFHTVRDASKAALVALCDLLGADGDPRRLVDVQWSTDHLASLGVTEVPRADYLALLPEVLRAPLPHPWA